MTDGQALGTRPAGRTRRERRNAFLLRWHRRLALLFALPLLVQLLTGAALVFKPEMVRSTGAGGGAATSLGPLLEAVAVRYPQAAITRVDMPAAPGSPLLFHLRGTHSGTTFVEVDAAGRITELGWTAQFFEWVRTIHDELALPEAGPILVATTGCALLILATSGLLIWWPGVGRIGSALRFPRRGAARLWLFHWHRSLGAVAGVVLVWMAATGMLLSLAPRFAPAWKDPRLAARFADADARLAAAQALFPGLSVRDVRLAGGAVERVLLHERHGGATGPVSQVRFDPASGAVTGMIDAGRLPAGSRAMAWLYPLHTAQAGGVPARLVLQAAGLAAVTISMTGLALWWVRRPRRRA